MMGVGIPQWYDNGLLAEIWSTVQQLESIGRILKAYIFFNFRAEWPECGS